MRAASRAIGCIALAIAGGAAAAGTARAQQGAGDARGSIKVVVIAAGTSQPLPYADVAIASEHFNAFTDAAGTLTIRQLPARPLTLRVRRIGFTPVSVTVAVKPDAVQTVRVALPPVAVRLANVRVSGDVCPGTREGDSAVVAILQQVRLNAERYSMLAEEYPFVVTMERVYGNSGFVSEYYSRRTGNKVFIKEVLRQDTVENAGRSEWRYAPGKLIVPVDDADPALAGVTEKLMVPQLADFADSAFIAAHCFRYAGLERVDSALTVLRVDFQPARAIKTPDVRGSLYFDTLSYQIRKSRLITERPSPTAPATDTWHLRVDTWFTEFLPGIPVIDEIASVVTTTSNMPGRNHPDRSATEEHKRLSLRFTRTFPGTDALPGVTPLAVAADADAILACGVRGSHQWLATRPSPLDSAAIEIEGAQAKLCYSHVSARGRPVYDSLAPFGRVWRAGTNEPTTLHLSAELEVAGVVLAPGRYVMQVIPGAQEWRVIFSTATGSDPAQMLATLVEVGRGTAPAEQLGVLVDPFRIRAATDGAEPAFLLEWGGLRARIPVWTRR